MELPGLGVNPNLASYQLCVLEQVLLPPRASVFLSVKQRPSSPSARVTKRIYGDKHVRNLACQESSTTPVLCT